MAKLFLLPTRYHHHHSEQVKRAEEELITKLRTIHLCLKPLRQVRHRLCLCDPFGVTKCNVVVGVDNGAHSRSSAYGAIKADVRSWHSAVLESIKQLSSNAAIYPNGCK